MNYGGYSAGVKQSGDVSGENGWKWNKKENK
jgi:hypothetical protein